jgi:hypothetical protein
MSSYNLEIGNEIFCHFLLFIYNNNITMHNVGLDRLVGIATRYSLDDLVIEYRFSASVQTGPGAHPISYTTGTVSFPGLKRSGSTVTHPPASATEVKKNRAMPLFPFRALMADNRVSLCL